MKNTASSLYLMSLLTVILFSFRFYWLIELEMEKIAEGACKTQKMQAS